VDTVLDAARTTADKNEQAKLYGRFQEMLLEDSPGSVIYVQNFACGISNKVRDIVVSPLMVLDFSKAALAA
jgi:ABC-type transport system substrate-binding protein